MTLPLAWERRCRIHNLAVIEDPRLYHQGVGTSGLVCPGPPRHCCKPHEWAVWSLRKSEWWS